MEIAARPGITRARDAGDVWLYSAAMTQGKRRLGFFTCMCLAGSVALVGQVQSKPAKLKPVDVTLNQISADGVGSKVGTITIRQTKDGVELGIDLSGLTPGEHGFHLHEHGSCDPADKEGKKTSGQSAGAHWDPDGTKAHKGPGGGGHKGDLPKLTVPESGKVKTKVSVAGLTLADLAGKSLMIHAGGDNYSDAPKPLGGGGDRIVCGVIPGGTAAPAGSGPSPVPAAAPKKAGDQPAPKP
jgi:Cu-Zn family superoxide dismutase